MNIQVQVCGLLIMLLLYIFYKSSNTLKLYTEKVFHQAMCTSMLCLSLDILSIVVIQNRSALPLLFVDTICKLYIITLVWVSMFAFVYVLTDLYSEEKHIQWSRKIKGIVLVQSILIYILPIKIFAEGRVVYTYGDAVLAVYASVTVYIVATLVTIGVRFKQLNKRRAAAVGLWMFVYICAAIIQFMNNELLLVGFASAIGLLILFVVMENPEANLDRRIGCFNAYALSEYMNKQLEKQNSFSVMEVSFNDLDYLKQIAEIGIFIGDESKRNKGLGSEAISLLVKYGFEYLNLNNIMLKVYSFNERAIKSYKKCGFKEFGKRHQVLPMHNKLYDEIYMEILKNDYFKQNY